MKALTLHQPWASLVVRGTKRFETRDWKYDPQHAEALDDRTPARYAFVSELPIRLAIHAAAQFPPEAIAYTRWLRDARGIIDTEDLPLGAIVGTVRYVGWHYSYPETRRQLRPSSIELDVGDWTDGRLLWEFEDPIELERPIAVRGAQRIWNWLAPEYDRAIAALAGAA